MLDVCVNLHTSWCILPPDCLVSLCWALFSMCQCTKELRKQHTELLNFQLILLSFQLIVLYLPVRDLFERKIPARHLMPEMHVLLSQ